MSEEIAQLRAIVAGMPPAPEGMGSYLAKVRERAYTVTDADVEQLEADGFSEDEIFEQTVAVAIAQGLRRFDAAVFQAAHELGRAQCNNDKVFGIFADCFERDPERDIRRATQTSESDAFPAQILERLEFRSSHHRVDQRLRGEPDRFRRQAPECGCHRVRTDAGDVVNIAARQRRVCRLRAHLNNFHIEPVLLEDLPPLSGK